MTRWFLLAAAIFVVIGVGADEPWQKSYKEWDAKDLRKILNDSPWSKTVEIAGNNKPSLEAPEGAPKIAGAREEDEDEAGEKDEDRPRDEKKKDEMKFVIRWVSSRTLREASVRSQMLQGKIRDADADKYMAPASEDYELALVGMDMTSFQGVDDSALKQETYLIAKKSKEKMTASQVEIVRSPNGKRINAIVFHFPQKDATGRPRVSLDEKELQFNSRAGKIEIKVNFDPQKMVDREGPDL